MSEEDPFSKTSFPPISDANTEILILGSLPGDQSLKAREYFAHPRNRFWKIIAAITNEALPRTYPEKLELLHRNRIGLWNVLNKASRKGSLDSAISDGIPNDLPAFMAEHKKLKVVAFDGIKPETLYDRHFSRRSDLAYFRLPGCSPANARFDLKTLCERWAEILDHR